MNHSQFDQFMAELRAIRAVLECSAKLADRLVAPVVVAPVTDPPLFPPYPAPAPDVAEGLGRATEEADAEALARSFDNASHATPKPAAPAPGAQRKRGERRGK